MTDTEIRIACVQAAAATPGNPNHIQMAREYYNFVTEGTKPDPVVAVHEVLKRAPSSRQERRT